MNFKNVIETLFYNQLVEIIVPDSNGDDLSVGVDKVGNIKKADATIYDNSEVVAMIAKDDILKIYVDY